VKSLTFGLKKSDKKAKNFKILAKTSIKILKSNPLSNVKEGEIEKINKEKKLKKLEKKKDNKFPYYFKDFLRHKYLFY
jgi:hypothetical protein